MPDPSAFYTVKTMKLKCNEALREDFCRYFSTWERKTARGDVWVPALRHVPPLPLLKRPVPGRDRHHRRARHEALRQVFLYDAYNDMDGPIEVEQVTHIFSQKTGFLDGDHPGLGRGRPFPETA